MIKTRHDFESILSSIFIKGFLWNPVMFWESSDQVHGIRERPTVQASHLKAKINHVHAYVFSFVWTVWIQDGHNSSGEKQKWKKAKSDLENRYKKIEKVETTFTAASRNDQIWPPPSFMTFIIAFLDILVNKMVTKISHQKLGTTDTPPLFRKSS